MRGRRQAARPLRRTSALPPLLPRRRSNEKGVPWWEEVDRGDFVAHGRPHRKTKPLMQLVRRVRQKIPASPRLASTLVILVKHDTKVAAMRRAPGVTPTHPRGWYTGPAPFDQVTTTPIPPSTTPQRQTQTQQHTHRVVAENGASSPLLFLLFCFPLGPPPSLRFSVRCHTVAPHGTLCLLRFHEPYTFALFLRTHLTSFGKPCPPLRTLWHFFHAQLRAFITRAPPPHPAHTHKHSPISALVLLSFPSVYL